MRDQTTPSRTAPEACLDMMNFGARWNDWRESLKETVTAARELDPSDRNVIPIVEEMIDFLAQRVCPGSLEERIVAEMWDRATAEEREVIARLFLRMVEGGPMAAP